MYAYLVVYSVHTGTNWGKWDKDYARVYADFASVTTLDQYRALAAAVHEQKRYGGLFKIVIDSWTRLPGDDKKDDAGPKDGTA